MNEKVQNDNKENKGTVSKKTFIISFLVLIVVCIAVVSVLWFTVFNKKNTNVDVAEDPNVITRETKNANTLEDLQKEVDESKIGIEIASNCILESGDSNAKINVSNTSETGKSFLVRIVLTDSGEEVYRSGKIPPDGQIKEAPFNKKLEKGTYAATAYFDSFKADGTSDGTVGLNITITVKS